MQEMFLYTSFKNLSSWDVSNVTNMSGMFREAYNFNGDHQVGMYLVLLI